MVIHFRQYFVDFDNMYMWADFDLRLNHAAMHRNPHPNYKRPEHIKPNLDLISFWEMKWIKGDLKMWVTEEKQWLSAFPKAPEIQKQLNELYLRYVFEDNFLKP